MRNVLVLIPSLAALFASPALARPIVVKAVERGTQAPSSVTALAPAKNAEATVYTKSGAELKALVTYTGDHAQIHNPALPTLQLMDTRLFKLDLQYADRNDFFKGAPEIKLWTRAYVEQTEARTSAGTANQEHEITLVRGTDGTYRASHESGLWLNEYGNLKDLGGSGDQLVGIELAPRDVKRELHDTHGFGENYYIELPRNPMHNDKNSPIAVEIKKLLQ